MIEPHLGDCVPPELEQPRVFGRVYTQPEHPIKSVINGFLLTLAVASCVIFAVVLFFAVLVVTGRTHG